MTRTSRAILTLRLLAMLPYLLVKVILIALLSTINTAFSIWE